MTTEDSAVLCHVFLQLVNMRSSLADGSDVYLPQAHTHLL